MKEDREYYKESMGKFCELQEKVTCPQCKCEHIKTDTYPYCTKECKKKNENTTPTN